MSAENLPYDVMTMVYFAVYRLRAHRCGFCHKRILFDVRCRDIAALQCANHRWRQGWNRFALFLITHEHRFCVDPIRCTSSYLRRLPSVPYLHIKGQFLEWSSGEDLSEQ